MKRMERGTTKFVRALAFVTAVVAGAAGAPAVPFAGQQGRAGSRPPSPTQPVAWSGSLERPDDVIAPGATATVLVTARVQEGWHFYSSVELPDGPRPMAVVVAPGQPFELAGRLTGPDPTRDFDEAFNQVTSFYTANTTFRLPVRKTKSAPPGAVSFELEITFQACDGRICLPGRAVKVTVAAPARR